MKIPVLLSLLFFSSLVFAGPATEDPERSSAETMMKQGRMMSVSLTLGNPLRIFVSGKEEGKLDLSKLKLTVRRLQPYPQQELKVNKDGNFYTVVNRDGSKTPFEEIEVTTSVHKTNETFNFKIENTKP